MSTYDVIAILDPRRGQDSAVSTALWELAQASRAEAANRGYEVRRVGGAAPRFVVRESWSSSESFEAHLATPHVASFLARADELLTGPPQILPLQGRIDAGAVAVLGTGIMGSAMARRLSGAGLDVRVWNRTFERAAALADVATPYASAAEAVADASFILTMLADADTVRSVVLDDTNVLAAAASDAIWIQSSTVGSNATERFMAIARERGVGFVDAPVVGTRQPAEHGQLTVLVSGRPEHIAVCRPLFEAIGNRTLELGASSEASRMKLATNAWVLGVTTTLAECVALAKRLGLEPAGLLEVISGTAVDSQFVRLKGQAMIEGHYPPAFPLRHAAKDADLIAEASGLSPEQLGIVEAVRRHLSSAIERGHGHEDIAAVISSITEDEGATPLAAIGPR